uniref:Uncharacterized protein n=1 Tax=Plectus sambesii TaxID=2011161 RepID=A0A914WAV3_9BILA
MLGASSSEEEEDDVPYNDRDDVSEVLSVPRRQRSSTTPRSQSPAPSDSVSYSGSISRTGGTPRHNDSFASSPMPARSVSS